MPGKLRLDRLMVERELADSRSKAAAMIMAAEVFVNERLIDKPGTAVPVDASIRVKAKPRYVSRGGLKLEAAVARFRLDLRDKVCADVGASTGGFTDCLLQHGAARVYAIDVGSGLLDYRLRIDSRVRPLENTNARFLELLPERVDFISIDVSFISLRLILPRVKHWLSQPAHVIALVKPQFEAGKADVGKGGIVRDPEVHRRVLRQIILFAQSQGFVAVDLMPSPIKGQKGNTEFLLWLSTKDDQEQNQVTQAISASNPNFDDESPCPDASRKGRGWGSKKGDAPLLDEVDRLTRSNA